MWACRMWPPHPWRGLSCKPSVGTAVYSLVKREPTGKLCAFCRAVLLLRVNPERRGGERRRLARAEAPSLLLLLLRPARVHGLRSAARLAGLPGRGPGSQARGVRSEVCFPLAPSPAASCHSVPGGSFKPLPPKRRVA